MQTTDEQQIQWVNDKSHHALTGHWELHLPAHWVFWDQDKFFIHGLAVHATAYLRVNEARLLVYPEDIADMQAQSTQLGLHQATDFYFRIVTPTGNIELVRCLAANDVTGTTIRYKGSFQTTRYQPVENSAEETLENGTLCYAEQLTQTGSWQINLHTNQAVFSPNIYRLHDVIPGSLPPSPDLFHRYIHPEEKQLVEKTFQQALSLRVPVHIEYRIVTENNMTRFVKLLSKIVRNDKGQDLLIGSMQDLTDSRNNELQTKAAQEELDINRQIVAELEQTAHAGYCLLHLQTRKLFCSDSCCRLFGLRPSGTEPNYDSLLSCMHPEDKELFGRCFQSAFDKRVLPPAGLRIFHANGKLRHIRMTGKLTKNATGEPLMIVLVRDITHEHVEEQQVRELSERNNLLEQTVSHGEASLGAGHWWLNPETKQVYFSPHFYQLHGVKAQKGPDDFELLEKFVYPDDRKILKNEWENAVSGRLPATVVYRIIKPEGQLRWLRLEIKPVHTNKKEYWVQGVIQDCTEEILLQQKMESQNRFTELLSHSIQEQLFVTDRSHNLVFCNKQFEKEQQLKLTAIKGSNLFDVLPLLKHPAVTTVLNEVLSGKPFHLPRFRSPVSGKMKEIFALPVKSFEDKIEGILFVIRNLALTDELGQPVKIPYFVEDLKEQF